MALAEMAQRDIHQTRSQPNGENANCCWVFLDSSGDKPWSSRSSTELGEARLTQYVGKMREVGVETVGPLRKDPEQIWFVAERKLAGFHNYHYANPPLTHCGAEITEITGGIPVESCTQLGANWWFFTVLE
ncbi:hypothetical protein [Magnetofaba australis]|uniref:Uncharacterized protein n=1 Tax=Magnetofaba australis IT-1 TaxID=1434232 RepID=A0A1Y2K0K3_9PROT|nr:hypothetical protein [Magnetofaba australis]OSM01482.1 hypothetical protein MAIT1_01457 [Magnetofaba australis IT-1]